jgi:hypothetical protein
MRKAGTKESKQTGNDSTVMIMDKNKRDFLSMLVEKLTDRTDGMTNDEINKFFG